MSENRIVMASAIAAAAAGRPAVLATIIRARGSTPRGVGSRMLIDAEGGITGTIGGGCGEGAAIEAAAEVMRTAEPTTLHIDLTEDLLSWSPAVCGGWFDVFLEPVGSLAPDPSTPLSPEIDDASAG